MKLLWLCSWYPNKIKPYDGDFIQRHAQAVSLLHKVHVIHVVKEEGKTGKAGNYSETVSQGNLTETIIYYNVGSAKINIVGRLRSQRTSRRLYKDAVKIYLQANPDVQLVHLHVPFKAGAIALWIKNKFYIPFIVSDHWTGYLPDAKPNYNDLSWWQKQVIQKCYKQASHATFVSKELANAVSIKAPVNNYSIIPNVVNTKIFFPATNPIIGETVFMHVSTNTYQKNIEQLLEACVLLKHTASSFILRIFVPDPENVHDLVLKHGLEKLVLLHSEVPQTELAHHMQQAHALILYSRYETFGCVVIEANACGIPAIVSDLPVFRENVINNETAILVEPNNASALAQAMKEFMNTKWNISPEEIANRTASKFSYEVVARQFSHLYQQLIN